MVSFALFNRLGFCVVEDFVPPGLAADIIRSSRGKPTSAVGVYGTGQGETLREEVRRTKRVAVDREPRVRIQADLWALRDGLERHFGVQVTSCDPPEFLRYEPGDFFKLHADGNRDEGAPPGIGDRKVSIVVFLNTQRARGDEGDDGYSGGDLVFSVSVGGQGKATLGVPFPARPGLLVAFSPHALHEVRPVLGGERYSLVSWFR